MRTFDKLTTKELADLNHEQVEAYIDITLAQEGIKKPLNVNIDFPDFLKPIGNIPERDMFVYEVDGKYFLDIKSAEKYATFLQSLEMVRKDYDYDVGSQYHYAQNKTHERPSIRKEPVYSEAKYAAIKEQLKQFEAQKKKNEKNAKSVIEDVIDYEAIDKIKENIRNKVRSAIEFFNKANTAASQYEKYFAVINDKKKTIATLCEVYGIDDGDLKSEITRIVNTLKTPGEITEV